MGKRYHCEFCDKSFRNNAASIKKHQSSLYHERARQEHYAQFKDPEVILREESQKKSCTRFMSGECQFGVLCRFSHYSPAQLHAMQIQVFEEKRRKNEEPSLASWLQKRSTKQVSKPENDVSSVVFAPPTSISCIPNLPPSLQPVLIKDFANYQPQSWGS
ncbi:zinc finger matrin-type protein 5-like [Cloeon dipterum]|uniref:zinc finger matrin-type protein 5-like n=1 Tax=Cloeon dipterum TaxID=197152 RepID=UPI00321FBCAC